ncbi:MAG: hypothetical protein HQL11_00750, partial [Candidatus Omnitrophica bacterium]|nr:hypothetical protein [Candidatus Omnitrophota bacterium]
ALAAGKDPTVRDPRAASRFWWKEGLAFWREEPMAALRLWIHKVDLFFSRVEIWNNVPYEFVRGDFRSLRWAPLGAGWVMPFAVLGLGAALVSGDSRRRLLGLMAVSYVASVTFFYVSARYRLPLMGVMILLAALAAEGVLKSAGRLGNASERVRAICGVGVLVIAGMWVHHDALSMNGIGEEVQLRYGEATMRVNLGSYYMRAGAAAKARSEWEKALELYPGFDAARRRLNEAGP